VLERGYYENSFGHSLGLRKELACAAMMREARVDVEREVSLWTYLEVRRDRGGQRLQVNQTVMSPWSLLQGTWDWNNV
jgi:hypothetical protein